MIRSIISLMLVLSWAATAPAATVADLSDGAPDRYVVVKGDTLWAISARFLKSPWKWGELWQMNREQIRNPHWIYPGNVLVLDRSQPEVRLRLLPERLPVESEKLAPQARATPLDQEAVPTIPTADIEPFLSKPLVIAQGGLAGAARIVAAQEGRVAIGAGDLAYAEGITEALGADWNIYRPGTALVDPDTHETLGYEAVFAGEVRVVRYGPVSTVQIVKSPLEISPGDYLLPAPRQVSFERYAPRPPERNVNARIISAYGGFYEVGSNAIVTLNKGVRDGLEVGHVLAIYRDLNVASRSTQAGPVLARPSVFSGQGDATAGYQNQPVRAAGAPAPRLPDARYGLLMVFRVFDRASYALIMNADQPVHVLDKATNP